MQAGISEPQIDETGVELGMVVEILIVVIVVVVVVRPFRFV